MLIIRNKNGSYVPGMGGDPRLFSQLAAMEFVKERLSQDPDWTRDGAILEPYIPNPMHLDAIEYLGDKGFKITLDLDGDYVIIDCDTLWTSPMIDLLNDTLLNGEHYLNRDYDFKVVFGKPRAINCSFQDHSLRYPIFFQYLEKDYTPSIWKRKAKQ